MPDTSVVEAVRVVGPLAPYAPRFADELRRRGYTECSTAGQLRLMAHASRWLANQGLDAAGFTPQRLAAFSADRVATGYRGLRTGPGTPAARGAPAGRGALPVPTAPEPESSAEHLLARYRGFLEGERGVVEKVSARWLRVAARFLAEHPGLADGTAAIGAAEVSAFCVKELPSRSASAAQNLAASLRTSCASVMSRASWTRRSRRRCHRWHGACTRACPVGSPRTRAAGSLRAATARTPEGGATTPSCSSSPARAAGGGGRAPSPRRRRLAPRRDRRARQGNRVEKMPLPVDVGEAVADYLSEGRPRAESRAVFLRAIAPWTALSAGGVTWIVYGRMSSRRSRKGRGAPSPP